MIFIDQIKGHRRTCSMEGEGLSPLSVISCHHVVCPPKSRAVGVDTTDTCGWTGGRGSARRIHTAIAWSTNGCSHGIIGRTSHEISQQEIESE
jgi:hypothetical protein